MPEIFDAVECSLVTRSLMSNAPNNMIEAANFFMLHIPTLAKAKDVPDKIRALTQANFL